MNLTPALIIGPMVLGVILLCIRSHTTRAVLVTAGAVAVAAGTLAMAGGHFLDILQARLPVTMHGVSLVMTVLSGLFSIYLLRVGLRSGRTVIVWLAAAQALLLIPFELTQGRHVEVAHVLVTDQFAIIMALIIGLVGGLICVFSIRYMRDYHHHHPALKDRQPWFFALLFIFLGAMMGLVFANHLLWIYFFWELTTLCSFWLIGYTGAPEARNNALRALTMNLAGGLGFAIAIVAFHRQSGAMELSHLIRSTPSVALLPVVFLAFAGLTKSAQMPFSSWLLGAMVAPTPVSALLHSSTMVNAGVYLIIRLAPALTGTYAGTLVAFIGGVTFLLASFAAIGARDAKKVLAFSTIANLGLIVLCGGIGTYEAVWAGVLLIIFHAIAKGLLFLCVGAVESRLGSRDIEDMTGLVLSMPRLSVMLLVGMAGMFLAPFGMLISKWAVLKAVVDAQPIFVAFVVFGSAATLFFWVKWMGKLLEVIQPADNIERGLGAGLWVPLYALTVMTFFTCMFFPLVSSRLIDPYVMTVFHQTTAMDHGNMVIMVIMLAMVALFPLTFLNYGHRVKVVDAYLSGRNIDGSAHFQGAAGAVHPVRMNNYYMGDLFKESQLMSTGVWVTTLTLVFLLGMVCI